jgi:hypothetical protein
MGLSGVVGLADWVWWWSVCAVLLGNGLVVVKCGLWGVWVEEFRLTVARGRGAGVGELQRGKCVLVVRVERQLGSGA